MNLEFASAQDSARSVHNRGDVREFNKCEIGRDAYPSSDLRAGIGSITVASAWLAFYVIAAVHSLAFGN